MNKNESRESILAEMRHGLDQSWHDIDREWVRGLPERIEAAWKRDEARAVEHATRHAEAVARDNCRDCVHNPKGANYEPVTERHAIGNAAAMRDALERVVEIADREWKSFRETPAMKEMRDVCTSALSAPASGGSIARNGGHDEPQA